MLQIEIFYLLENDMFDTKFSWDIFGPELVIKYRDSHRQHKYTTNNSNPEPSS